MAQPRPASSTSPAASLAPVLLKKYGNRRLYDTNASRYVTLEEVEEMVQRGTDIQVVDAKSHEDLTKEILVQIILDKEQAKEMLPTGFLKQVVRLSSSPLKESFTRALQDSLDGFLSTQRQMFEAQRAMVNAMPQAFSSWNPFAAFTPPSPGPLGHAPMSQPMSQPMQTAPAAAKDTEVDRLRQEVSETQALLRQLIDAQGAGARPGRKKPRARPR
jgi:polyhydroxyalkanoate synthesis repressor PhaR